MQAQQDRQATLMRAVSLTGYGSEEGFIFLKSQPRPEIEESEVLVKVKCCAITEQDRAVLKGSFTELTRLPMVLGFAISGTVEAVGMEVVRFKPGDEVVGVSPLNVGGGYAEYAVFGQHDLVLRPAEITHEEASSALIGGLRAYTALHYKAKIVAGDTVLIFNGASGYGHIALQLACLWGAKVLTTASSAEEINYLQDLPNVERIIDTSTENLFDAVMEETGGIGLDYIFETPGPSNSMATPTLSTREGFMGSSSDNSPLLTRKSSSGLQTKSPSSSLSSLPSLSGGGGKNYLEKTEIIKCLAVNGTWISSSLIQLDPPESKLMLLKNCNISFLFEQAWALAPLQQGRYLHILADVMDKVAKGEIMPKIGRVYPLEKIREAHRNYDFNLVGTVIVKN